MERDDDERSRERAQERAERGGERGPGAVLRVSTDAPPTTFWPTESGPAPAAVNKTLLEHSRLHLVTCYLWLLSRCRGGAEPLELGLRALQRLKR